MSEPFYPPRSLSSFNKLTAQTLRWADERKLTLYSTPFAQLAKLYEELGELSRNCQKGASVVDDIGDILVVLTILLELIRPFLRITSSDLETLGAWADDAASLSLSETWLMLTSCTGELSQLCTKSLATNAYTDQQIKQPIIGILSAFRYFVPPGISFQEFMTDCFLYAYNEIKDRKGTLTPQGVFVKEEDQAKVSSHVHRGPLPASTAGTGADSGHPSKNVTSSVAPQIGGSHYQDLAIQPWEYFTANASFAEIEGACKHNVLKYMRKKNDPKEDLLKAKWYLDEWINLYS